MSRKERVVTRQELFDLVWEKPARQLAEQFGVSDVALGKICKRMDVPKPARGYWAKIEAGRKPQKPKLPQMTKGGVAQVTITPSPTPSASESPKQPVEAIGVPLSLTDPHPLTSKTLNALGKGKADERGIVHSRNKVCLDIKVAEPSLERGCLVMDALIKALSECDMLVKVDKSVPPKTLVTVDGETFSIGIVEQVSRSDHFPTKQERAKWGDSWRWMITKYDYQPNGQLSLRIHDAPHGTRQQWSGGKQQRLEKLLGNVLQGLRNAASRAREIRAEREQWEKEWQERERRRKELERLERIAHLKAEKLEKDVAAWQRAEEIRRYLQTLKGSSKNPQTSAS